MKKGLIMIAATALLLLLLCSWASAEKSTTILVYMCGAEIPDDACVDLEEMAIVRSAGKRSKP